MLFHLRNVERFSLAVAVVGIIVASAIALPTVAGSDREKYLIIGSENEDVATLAFDKALRNAQYIVADNVYDRLVEFELGNTPSEGKLPCLATSWDVNEDKTEWVFHLREGVQFHHGYGEMTSTDVKASLERSRDLGKQSALLDNIVDIELLDRYTVKIILDAPDLYFLDKQANRKIGPIFPAGYSEEDLATKPVGTGPFEFESFVPADEIVLNRFEDSWREPAKLEGIVIRFIPENITRVAAFKAGEIDICECQALQWEQISALQEEGFILDMGGAVLLNLFFFNTQYPPFDDVRVRKAVAYAIDRDELAAYFGPVSEPAVYPLPWVPDRAKPEDIARYDHDPDKARDLLAEAGYPNGFSFKTVIYPLAYYQDPLLIMQDSLAEVGIDMIIEVVDGPSYRPELQKPPGYPVATYHFSRFPAVPATLLEFYYGAAIPGQPTGRQNYTWSDELDPLITDILSETDYDKHLELVKQFQYEVMDNCLVHCNVEVRRIVLRAPYIELGYDFQSTLFNNYPDMWTLTKNI